MKTVINIEEFSTRWALCILLLSAQSGRGGKGWTGADPWLEPPAAVRDEESEAVAGVQEVGEHGLRWSPSCTGPRSCHHRSRSARWRRTSVTVGEALVEGGCIAPSNVGHGFRIMRA
jgi:hypothetical protein